MESFHWGKHFLTGLTDVDKQHHHLVDIINTFGNLLAENTIVFEDIEVLFKELTEYSHYHFEEEEAMMVKEGIDHRHLKNHIQIHQNFLDDVTALCSGVTEDNIEPAKHLLNFLTHWLVYHMLGKDQNMARQIAAIQSGVNPSDAYIAEEKESDQTTEPLLVALNGLFEQVSARNKELLLLNQSLEEKVAQRTKELSEANIHLEELSLTDVLTGLPNRRHAMRYLASLWDESTKNDLPLVCMMVDADHFKEVNDTFGHDAGDVVLIELAKTLGRALRNDDIVCRLGGDEFFILCPNTNQEGGMYIAELTRKLVSELRVPTGGEPWHGSISIGVASRSTNMNSYEELIKVADNGVYLAKEKGKNRVETTD